MKFDEKDLSALERDLNLIPQALENATAELALELRSNWKHFVRSVGAVDSGEYLKSVLDRKMTAKEFLIEDDSGYSQIVELGRTDTDKYPGRLPVKKALEMLDNNNVVERFIENEFDKILKKT